MQHDAAAKLERRTMCDELQQASARFWPVKKKFKEVTARRKAVALALEPINGELAALPPPRIGLLDGPPNDPYHGAKAAWMAVRGLTAAPPVAPQPTW